MDFQTMVNRFRNSVITEGEEQVDELTQRSRNVVQRYIDDGTPNKDLPQYSFAHLFENPDDMRIAIAMDDRVGEAGTKLFRRIVQDLGWEPAFTQKTVQQKRRREGGEEYVEELTIPDLQMKKTETRTIPRGPRAGEVIEREVKTSLGKIVEREGTDEEKAWWKENQNTLREMRNVRQWFLKPYLDDFSKVSKVDKPIIIISRHPLDVARMSDFSMTRSCHTEGRSHFNCALHEAKGHGMVAFLVKKSDWDEWELDENLQEDEIFGDRDVRLSGPEPIGRVRIRKLYNEETEEEFAVAEDRTYGATIPDFLPTVRKWLRDNQRDIWLAEDGGLNLEAFEDGEWVYMGGDYFDTKMEEQLELLFADTEWEEAAEQLGNLDIGHSDPYDEATSGIMEEAEERLNRMLRDYETSAEYINVYADIEEGWDDMAYVANCGMNAPFFFEIPEGWAEDERAIGAPDRDSSWRHRRDAVSEIEEIVQRKIYAPDNLEIDMEEVPTGTGENSGYKILIELRASYSSSDIDEIDNQLNEYIDEVDKNYEELKKAFLVHLKEEGYLPPSGIMQAIEKLEEMEFQNIEVIYDEDELVEGILIKNKDREAIPIGDYYRVDPVSGLHVGQTFIHLLHRVETSTDRSAVYSAKIRRAFKKMSLKAFRLAQKQLGLPGIPQKEAEVELLPKELDFKFDVKAIGPRDIRDMFSRRIPDIDRKKMAEKVKIKVGYHFGLEIPYEAEKERFEAVAFVAKYIDENIDKITAAAKGPVDDLWSESLEQAKEAYEAQKEKADVQQLSPTAMDQARDRLREMIKKTIKKKLMEQTGFETRLFQVTLRLSVDKDQGGGIEQKLNRIRAIEGVTVVSHVEGDAIAGKDTIEAKIKFHPEKDSEQGITYVRRILMPDINSSKHVPGVKVLDFVRGSFKRIDK
jgi:hypothetical protein